MSYIAGIGPGMERYGFTPGEPRVICDGCGLTSYGLTRSGQPSAWLRNGKAPPGWIKVVKPTDTAPHHYCGKCKEAGSNGTR